ncbi:MAG: PAS domain S-box protein [Thermoplasmata archaeon]
MKILFVDDEKGLLDQAKIFLEREDESSDVETAISADKALESLTEDDYDVIVSDYQMPEKDGLELLRIIRDEMNSDVPFIMFTGEGREEVAMKALNLGADRYLQKGGSPKSQYGVLADAIKQELKHYKTDEALRISEEKYQSLTEDVMENSDVAMFILDSDFKIVWINKATEEYFGIEKEEVIGKDKEKLIRNKIKYNFEKPERFEKKVISTYKDNTYIENFECHVLKNEEKGLVERWLNHWSKPIETGLYEGGRMEYYTDITAIKNSEIEKEKHIHDLDERVKELECLYSLGRITRENDELSTVLEKIIDLIPPSWQYSEVTAARIICEDEVHKTEDFAETEWMLEEDIFVNGENVGSVEVCYLEEKPEEDEGPFLKEEIDLIRSIANHIGSFIEKKRAEEQHRLLFETINQGVVYQNRDGKITSANPAAQKMLGLSLKQMQGRKSVDPGWKAIREDGSEFPGEEHPAMVALETGEEVRDVIMGVFNPKKEKYTWIKIDAIPLFREGEDEPYQVYTTFKDVTERKKAKERLKESEEKYRNLFEEMNEGLALNELVFDGSDEPVDYRILKVNPNFESILGINKEDVVGKKATEAYGTDNAPYLDIYTKVAQTGKSTEFNTYFEPLDKYLRISVFSSEKNRFATVFNDITEKKKTMEKLEKERRLLEQTEDIGNIGGWEYDVEKDEMYWTENLFKLHDINKEDKKGHIEKSLEFYPPDAIEKVKKSFEKAVNEGESYDIEVPFLNADGKKMWIRTIGKPVIEDGEVKKVIGNMMDITDKKKKEEKLKTSEERYRRLFETAQDGMLIIDAETGEIKDANPYIQDILEYDKEELVGKELWQIGTFKDVVENKKRFEELVNEGYIRYRDLPLKTKYGDEAPVEFVSNTYEAGGEKVVQCNIRDIYERKKAESEMKESHRRFKAILNDPKIFIGILEKDGTIVSANDSSLDFIGCLLEDVKGKKFWKTPWWEHSEDLQERLKEAISMVADGNYDHFEATHIGEEGSEIIVDFYVRPVMDEHKNITSVIAEGLDITEKKRTESEMKDIEEKLKELHKIASEFDSLNSEEDICRTAVKAAEEILDFSVCSIDLIDENGKFEVKAVSKDVSEDDYAEKKPEKGGLGGKTFLENESYLVDDLEKYEYAEPVKDEYKSAISVPIKDKGIFQAISDKTGYFDERDLELAEILVSHVSAALDRVYAKEREEFLHSLLRHDIKNKTQVVKGYLELIDKKDLPEDVGEYLGKSKKTIDEGGELLEKVSKLRKVEKEKEITEVRLNSIIDQVLSEHHDQLEDKCIDIDVGEADCGVKGGTLLQELFSNIIENSIRHSNCKNIKIHCTSDDKYCTVTIEDDGKGIPDEIKENIFDKGSKDAESPGSGLGMYMVKEIARNYGGDVEVKDSEMDGARFDVRLEKV